MLIMCLACSRKSVRIMRTSKLRHQHYPVSNGLNRDHRRQCVMSSDLNPSRLFGANLDNTLGRKSTMATSLRKYEPVNLLSRLQNELNDFFRPGDDKFPSIFQDGNGWLG